MLVVDISHYQGAVDWTKFPANGIDGAIIKATEGTSGVDFRYIPNWAGMRAAPLLLRGYYHFARPDLSWLAQASHFCDTVGPLAPGEVVALDFELQPYDFNWASSWLRHVASRLNTVPWFYSTVDIASRAPSNLTTYPLWIADPTSKSRPRIAPWTDYALWQFGQRLDIGGIPLSVDVNYSPTLPNPVKEPPVSATGIPSSQFSNLQSIIAYVHACYVAAGNNDTSATGELYWVDAIAKSSDPAGTAQSMRDKLGIS